MNRAERSFLRRWLTEEELDAIAKAGGLGESRGRHLLMQSMVSSYTFNEFIEQGRSPQDVVTDVVQSFAIALVSFAQAVVYEGMTEHSVMALVDDALKSARNIAVEFEPIYAKAAKSRLSGGRRLDS